MCRPLSQKIKILQSFKVATSSFYKIRLIIVQKEVWRHLISLRDIKFMNCIISQRWVVRWEASSHFTAPNKNARRQPTLRSSSSINLFTEALAKVQFLQKSFHSPPWLLKTMSNSFSIVSSGIRLVPVSKIGYLCSLACKYRQRFCGWPASRWRRIWTSPVNLCLSKRLYRTSEEIRFKRFLQLTIYCLRGGHQACGTELSNMLWGSLISTPWLRRFLQSYLCLVTIFVNCKILYQMVNKSLPNLLITSFPFSQVKWIGGWLLLDI